MHRYILPLSCGSCPIRTTHTIALFLSTLAPTSKTQAFVIQATPIRMYAVLFAAIIHIGPSRPIHNMDINVSSSHKLLFGICINCDEFC